MTNLYYILHSGKNSKLPYYVKGYCHELIPRIFYMRKLKPLLQSISNRDDYEYILTRRNYYCQLSVNAYLPTDCATIGEWHCPKKQKVYYFDTQEYLRYFDPKLIWNCLPGDINFEPTIPSITKSRPINKSLSSNATILNLDKIRHFLFINDRNEWLQKSPTAIFRGKVAGKKERIQFMNLYFDSTICNCGDVSNSKDIPAIWHSPKLTVNQHLTYRYIMCLEGNDVASNLKWVMSSNSIAVMPQPTCETWFMEGTLVPDYHYIQIKPDFSDLEQQLDYYNTHTEEALQILIHQHQYISQFQNQERERLIALAVLDKYFASTNKNYLPCL